MGKHIFERRWALQQKLEHLYEHTERVHNGGDNGECWIDKLRHREIGRYPQMRDSLGWQSVVHYILFARLGRRPDQAGHLCHDPGCIRPAHVEEVSTWLNGLDKPLYHGERGDYTSPYPGVIRCDRHNNWTASFGEHDGGRSKYIAFCKSEQEAARIAIPLYLDELEREPMHIQQSAIYDRCHATLLAMWREVYLEELYQDETDGQEWALAA